MERWSVEHPAFAVETYNLKLIKYYIFPKIVMHCSSTDVIGWFQGRENPINQLFHRVDKIRVF
jgi:intein-encoded DNA endonuclease-like protein